jgi:hypothetical protein
MEQAAHQTAYRPVHNSALGSGQRLSPAVRAYLDLGEALNHNDLTSEAGAAIRMARHEMLAEMSVTDRAELIAWGARQTWEILHRVSEPRQSGVATGGHRDDHGASPAG